MPRGRWSPQARARMATKINGRRADVAELWHRGDLTLDAIAAKLNVNARTIHRDVAALGLHRLDREHYFVWTARTYWLARNLAEDGCDSTEIARSVGACDCTAVRRRFPEYFGEPGVGRDLLASHRHLIAELGL